MSRGLDNCLRGMECKIDKTKPCKVTKGWKGGGIDDGPIGVIPKMFDPSMIVLRAHNRLLGLDNNDLR